MTQSKNIFMLCLIEAGIIPMASCTDQSDRIPDPVKPLPYSQKELLSEEIRDTYKGEHLKQIAFPLGGIGSGVRMGPMGSQ